MIANCSSDTRRRVSSWHEPKALSSILCMRKKNTYALIGLVGRKAVCFGKLSIISAKKAEVMGIVVADNYQDKGIGKVLMCFLKEMAKKRGAKILELEVFNTNTRAIKFYKKLGYKSTTRKNLKEKSFSMEMKI
jgi:ribosomal protein S18 acetylase RimI-like enzyme